MPDKTNHLRPIRHHTLIRHFLMILVVMTGSHYNALAQDYFQQEVNYRIRVTLSDKHHELYAYETVEYINNSPDTLHFIYFHLWPNGYSGNNTELAKQLFNSQGKQLLFNDPELRGYIDSLNFTVNDLPVKWDLLPGQPDICRIVPEKQINPGDTVNISTPFHVKIPKGVTSRLGHIGESYQISQWYPKPAVYDQNGWHQMTYQDQGEFYSEFGNFDVSITLPENYIVGATGNLQNELEKDWMSRLAMDTTWLSGNIPKADDFPPSSTATKTLRFTQSKIHDFAWFADKRFHLSKGKVTLPNSGREVTTWALFTNHQANLWKDAIKYIKSSIEKFSIWNGDYPYQSFIAVQSSLSAGSGMEYPGMTVVGYAKDAYSLDEVIAHEVAHSWFYSALGSNERRYPFMDEGITSANEVRYMRDSYPHKKLWETFTDKLKLAKFFHIENMPVSLVPELEWLSQARDNLEQPLDLESSDYTTLNYSLMIYNKAGMSFNYLRAYLGDSLYDSTMKAYFLDWKFKHPQPDDLKKLFELKTGKDLSWFFGDLLGTTKRLDYKAVHLEENRLLVKNSGELVSPVVISGMTGDSVFFEKWVDGFEGKKWIEIPTGGYTEIKIDPNHQMPELYRLNNNIRKSGIFPKSDPLRTQMYFSLEDPEKRYLMFIPALNWTRENGIMIGAALHNGFLTPKPIEYFVMPFYAFNNSALAGFGKIAWNITPYAKLIQKAKISLEVSQFGAPGNQDYHYAKAGSEFFFRSNHMNNLLTQKASLNFTAASDLSQIELLEKASMKYYMQLGYQLQKTGFINPFLFSISLESSNSYLKSTAEMNYKLSYRGKKNGLDIRLFTGVMLHNSSDAPFYALAAGARNGHELYLYQGTYPDRFAVYPSTFFSRQMTVTEGGLASPVNEKLGFSKWLVSLSLTSTLPGNARRLPVKPFVNLLLNDHGSGNGHDAPFFCEAGFKAGMWNFFEIYVPILVSGNISSITGQFKSRIRLVFNLDSFSQAKLNSGMGIRIH